MFITALSSNCLLWGPVLAVSLSRLNCESAGSNTYAEYKGSRIPELCEIWLIDESDVTSTEQLQASHSFQVYYLLSGPSQQWTANTVPICPDSPCFTPEAPGSFKVQVKLFFASILLEPRFMLRYANISSKEPSLIYHAMIFEGGQGFRWRGAVRCHSQLTRS